MNIIRATLDKLAGVLACREDQAEEVLRSEASARASFSRRGLFKAAGAVAAGVVLADALPEDPAEGYEFRIRAVRGPTFVDPRVKAQWDAYFKDVYRPERVEKLVYPKDALLSRLDKDGSIHVYTSQPGVCRYTITAVDLARGEITVSS